MRIKRHRSAFFGGIGRGDIREGAQIIAEHQLATGVIRIGMIAMQIDNPAAGFWIIKRAESPPVYAKLAVPAITERFHFSAAPIKFINVSHQRDEINDGLCDYPGN